MYEYIIKVFEMNLNKALLSYEVEYRVLSEEIAPSGILYSPPDQMQRLEVMCQSLKRQVNSFLYFAFLSASV